MSVLYNDVELAELMEVDDPFLEYTDFMDGDKFLRSHETEVAVVHPPPSDALEPPSTVLSNDDLAFFGIPHADMTLPRGFEGYFPPSMENYDDLAEGMFAVTADADIAATGSGRAPLISTNNSVSFELEPLQLSSPALRSIEASAQLVSIPAYLQLNQEPPASISNIEGSSWSTFSNYPPTSATYPAPAQLNSNVHPGRELLEWARSYDANSSVYAGIVNPYLAPQVSPSELSSPSPILDFRMDIEEGFQPLSSSTPAPSDATSVSRPLASHYGYMNATEAIPRRNSNPMTFRQYVLEHNAAYMPMLTSTFVATPIPAPATASAPSNPTAHSSRAPTRTRPALASASLSAPSNLAANTGRAPTRTQPSRRARDVNVRPYSPPSPPKREEWAPEGSSTHITGKVITKTKTTRRYITAANAELKEETMASYKRQLARADKLKLDDFQRESLAKDIEKIDRLLKTHAIKRQHHGKNIFIESWAEYEKWLAESSDEEE